MKSYNNISMKGRVYNHSLEEEVTEKGDVIKGFVQIEVDSEGTIVELRFYASPTYSTGRKNSTYYVLQDIMAGDYNTVVDNGDEADWIAATGSIDVSYFMPRDGKDELLRSQKIRGAFLNPNKEKEYQNRWKLDFLMTNFREVDADAEKDLPRHLRIGGYLIDDYKETLLEVQFQARKDNAINYILTLSASEETPYFVSTWGRIATTTRSVVRKNAFGEDEIDTYNSSYWSLEGMSPEPHMFGDESAMTLEQYETYGNELKEVKAAAIKKAEAAEEDLPF